MKISMNFFENFNTEFVRRHDFYSDELNVFFKNWNNIYFKNIPEAWIIVIDSMLTELAEINVKPDYVEQEFGQLLILYKLDNFPKTDEDKDIIRKAMEKIKLIDEDLYLFFDIEPEQLEYLYFKTLGAAAPLYN